MVMEHEKIAMLAQKISHTYEDVEDKVKRGQFEVLFDKYLAPVDTSGTMEPYDAIIKLGRKNPEALEKLLEEIDKLALMPKDSNQ